MGEPSRVTAVLGPTNTGKTHYAIEKMLSHRTGVIGLPLRLLAREVYDRVVSLRGPSVVALITGEERIVPERPLYWVATTEAMPLEIGADIVIVDEIQLCADPERGHVFTNRLLHARGLLETLFLGSDTMRPAIAGLIPGVQFQRKERFSTLTFSGSKKISRMPERSAIVGFSVENVYAIAELIRRTKGGCAVVMGALSPRTRNAQVAMYQNGDVDYLVATDAIGMGLNLDIKHVAFASTSKFDGRRMRMLNTQEIGQIAGRAGRHTENGTFGVTGEARPFDEEEIVAIESHKFDPVRKLMWRNADLDFGSAERLIRSLEHPTFDPWLSRARDADDVLALKYLSGLPEVQAKLTGPQRVRLLWDVCRVPDFRGASDNEHLTLLTRIYEFLTGRGLSQTRIPADWLRKAIERIDKPGGEIDTISKRLAYIRTWTYIAQRKGWVEDESHWRDETRAVEDRLSDALHLALTQRFVDRRTSVLLRRLKQKETLVAEVNDKGEVTVSGEFVGKLDGFRFQQDATKSPEEAQTLRSAALVALKPEFHLRADRFYNAPDTEMDYTTQGGLMWGSSAIGKLVKGAEAMRPQVEVFVDEEAGPDVADKVRRRAQHFIDRKIAALFEPLAAMSRDEALVGLARGFAFRLVEAMGVIQRDEVANDVKALDQDSRAALRKHGVRFGQFTIFLPLLLKPAATRLRLVLWSLWDGLSDFPESPPPGLVTIPNLPDVPRSHYTLSGYHPSGTRAIRIDMLERLADILRTKDSRVGFEATPDMLSITGMTLEQFVDLMAGLGYKGEKAERVKVKAVVPVVEVKVEEPTSLNPVPEEVSLIHPEPAEEPPAEPVEEAAPEMESFYTFTWAPKPRARPERAARPERSGEPRGERPPRSGARRQDRGPRKDAAPADPAVEGAPAAEAAPRTEGGGYKGKRDGEGRSDNRKPRPKDGKREGGKYEGSKSDGKSQRSFEARPPRAEKPIDPDNPFAVLAALKLKP
ncbi:MAG: helicase-related protein [Cypionkella sp.]